MINSIAITLLLLGSLVAYKRLKRKKRQFHAPPSNQLPILRLNSVFFLSKRIVSNIPDKNDCYR